MCTSTLQSTKSIRFGRCLLIDCEMRPRIIPLTGGYGFSRPCSRRHRSCEKTCHSIPNRTVDRERVDYHAIHHHPQSKPFIVWRSSTCWTIYHWYGLYIMTFPAPRCYYGRRQKQQVSNNNVALHHQRQQYGMNRSYQGGQRWWEKSLCPVSN